MQEDDTVFAIVKRLLASNKISFIITALVVLCATSSGDVVLSNGNYTWLAAVLTPFFFVFYDFTKLMHLGATKRDYFFGCLISYVFLAFCISLVNTVIHLLIDPLYPARTVINMMDVCKWTKNGIIAAGLQQTAFLLLVMIFLHVLLSMQTRWYGWLTDAVLAAVICIFTPIAPLRSVLAGFFQLIMLNDNAVLHICICLLLIPALCLMLGSFVLAGCSSSREPFEEKTYTPDTQVTEIDLDVRDRQIEVSRSEDEQVHIKYAENSKEYYDISISDENVLTMSSANDKAWTDYIGGKASAEDRKISLQIPDALLETLTLSTTNEDITLSALTVSGNINISSNGGNIAFESLDAANALDLTAKNGDISGTFVGSYDDFAVRSEIKKGESNLPDRKDSGEKTLNVSCNNGDVNIEFVNR